MAGGVICARFANYVTLCNSFSYVTIIKYYYYYYFLHHNNIVIDMFTIHIFPQYLLQTSDTPDTQQRVHVPPIK